MDFLRIVFIVVILLVCTGLCAAQTAADNGDKKDPPHVASSPAYAEVVLRIAVLEAELEELLIRYTDDFPKVAETRFELIDLEGALRRLTATPEKDASKLTLALGKLLVRKAEYATEVDSLTRKYNDSHPEVKRAKRKLEIFEKAVNRIY